MPVENKVWISAENFILLEIYQLFLKVNALFSNSSYQFLAKWQISTLLNAAKVNIEANFCQHQFR